MNRGASPSKPEGKEQTNNDDDQQSQTAGRFRVRPLARSRRGFDAFHVVFGFGQSDSTFALAIEFDGGNFPLLQQRLPDEGVQIIHGGGGWVYSGVSPNGIAALRAGRRVIRNINSAFRAFDQGHNN